MKLNRFLLSLLFVPALSFMSCGDYEDTEVTSPQADENALGANFTAGAINVTVHPDKREFELMLNRLNTQKVAEVPVKVTACSEVSEGVKFCDVPETLTFMFAAGSTTATISLNLDENCKFQEVYQLKLTLGADKDNPYVSGTSSTVVSVTKDYKWKTLGQPVVLEDGWFNGGILAPVQWASDYKDDVNKYQLFRIAALYANAGKATSQTGHLQFLLDEDYNPQGMFTANGYNPEAINTAVPQNEPEGNEKAIYYQMNVKNIVRGGDKEEQKNTYVFTYDVFYDKNGSVENEFAGVTATLDFDIESQF